MISSLPIVEVAGTAFDCGLEHGKQLAEQISYNVNKYLALIERFTDLDKGQALSKAALYLQVVKQHYPELYEEMLGISIGAALDIEQIALLNARSELLASVPFRECTTIAVVPPATNGETLLAQNWDWYCEFESTCSLLKVQQLGKPKILMLVEAGQIGKFGMNSAGIGLAHNWLQSTYYTVGIPFLLLCRVILNSWSIKNAINGLCRYRRGSAGNYLIAHKSGFAVDFEMTPDAFSFLEPNNGILSHTNHFVSQVFRSQDEGLFQNGWDSIVRLQTVERLLHNKQSCIDKSFISGIQHDSSCEMDAVYVPKDPTLPLDEQWSTLACVIMNLSERTISIDTDEGQKQVFTL